MTSPPSLPPNEARDIQARIDAAMSRAAGKRVVFATVLNPFPLAIAETRLLLRSLRALGGRHADGPVRVHVVGGAGEELRTELEGYGADVRACDFFEQYERCYTANKLGMLEDIGDADYLLMLDNDVVIGGDITPHLVGDGLALKPECVDHLGMERWRLLFASFGLEIPPHRLTMTIDNEETIAYYNTGVMLVPRALIAPLRHGWQATIREVLEVCDREPALKERESTADQMALTICLAREPFPRRALPIAMHFHTRFAFHPAWEADRCRPVVLHHHHALNQDCSALEPSPHAEPNLVIAEVNEAVGAGRRREGAADRPRPAAGGGLRSRLLARLPR